MKRIGLIILSLLMTVCATQAQTANDSVRIKLQTTAGADIAIDGDWSSTNIMYTKVATGQHNVTVRYGSLFEKNYPIEVSTTGNTEFSFLIEGEANINSMPQATIFLDGIPQGLTPQTLKIIGTHNIKIKGDEKEYFDISDQITINPFEKKDFSYTLKKRPPRLYGMVIANYTGCKAFGATLALCRNWGAYLRIANAGGDFGIDSEGYPEPYYKDGFYGTGIYKKKDPAYATVTAGVMKRCHKYLFAYIGAGYGQYVQKYEQTKDLDDTEFSYSHERYVSGAKGVAGDIGIIVKYKALLLQVGYASILTGKFGDTKWHHDPYIGLGISIHKNKKRN